MDGLHLTADLHDCAPGQPAMTEPDRLRSLCMEAVRSCGLLAVAELFHRFAPAHAAAQPGDDQATGITGVVLLAESHLAVHTWPELAAVTLDVYVCNFGGDNSAKAQRLIDCLIAAFGPSAVERHALQRGRASTPLTTE